ncbi:MAG TPA: exodeoxyribonuclease V subunit gamma [Solirubrobacteraceae bacterium]|nr:exodeoxyribonuclease V subunit gamma [Solirubrobacteraceae bacterium]
MLHLHRASRADVLAHALARLLSAPPGDPFTPDVVAVPTRGMERWLAQTMSSVLGASPGRGDGVCANVLFPTPHRLLSDAVATASEIDPERDPWLPERLTWTLLEVVDAHLGDRWLAPLAAYLGGSTVSTAAGGSLRRNRRLSIVRHLAGLFDRYALHRPEMLAEWARGRDVDGAGAGLPPATAWQAQLWREAAARISVPGPADRRRRACEHIREDPRSLALPERLALFGLTRLPRGHLQVILALSAAREMHLLLLHPSGALWDAVAAHPESHPRGLRRSRDRTDELTNNALLASWGRDAREMQLVLAAAADPSRTDETEHPLTEGEPRTLLARLQADVRADRAAPGLPLPGAADERALLAPADESLVVHSCHGRARQVEVLRDAILHALAEDETIEPRDVIVMCPDIEAFAPLIQATFGAAVEAGAERGEEVVDLRVRLADRSLTQTNQILGVLAELMGLAGERLTASQVLDLADRGPLRRRFGLDDDDFGRLQDWIGQAGIRWGLDAEHRAPYALDAVAAGTWRAGLDRLLLGVTMTEDGDRLFERVLPLDDVDSRSIDLAGRFAELISRLTTVLDDFARSRPLAAWAEAIAGAADALTATSNRDRWQRAELDRILTELAGEAERPTPALTPAEARAHFTARLQGRPTRANFRTGHLTVCTLMPMRSVPHRIVCLLGLDDGAFPRKAPRDGDDLMLHEPRVGERDPRSEDRQLLLDAMLAATDRLIVTYSGNDERTNSERPPAVPVGELLDAVDATVRCPGDPAARDAPPAARDRVCVRHPLQPFDPRNFDPGALADAARRPWSFDEVALGGARALSGDRHPVLPFLPEALAPLAEPVVDLDDLVSFAERPVRAFLRRRLGISIASEEDEVDDALPIELEPLATWAVAERLLDALLRGSSLRVAARAEKARGTLPPDSLGDRVIDAVRDPVIAIATQAEKLRGGHPARDPIDVQLPLGSGRVLSGTISGVHGTLLMRTSYSRVSPRHRIGAWIRLLALSAAHPEEPFAAATIGRATRGSDVRTCWIPQLAEDPAQRQAVALAQLAPILELHDRGMREPLPIFPRTSAAWAEAAASGRDPRQPAEREWVSDWRFTREDDEPVNRLVLGGAVEFDVLLREPPRAEEAGEGWCEEESTRLGRLARRLWDGLLACEESESR